MFGVNKCGFVDPDKQRRKEEYMKIKAIVSAFKPRKIANISDVVDNDVQWISNGTAWYSLDGMPKFTPTSLLKMFDIPEEKQAEWTSEQTSVSRYIIDESKDYELEEMKMQIKWLGETYTFFKDEHSVLAINEKYLKPLYDEWDYLRYVAHPLSDGRTTVVLCYIKLELKAVILPVTLGDNLTRELSELLTLTFEGDRYETS